MKRSTKHFTAAVIAGVLVLCLAAPGSAQRFSFVVEGLVGYPSPQGYVYDHQISGIGLSSPEDLFIDSRGYLFIGDTGNNRVLKVDPSGAIVQEIGGRASAASGVTLSGPQGLFVSRDGTVYVADTGNYRIVVFNPDGSAKLVIERPRSHLLEGQLGFVPTKLVVDKRGFIYAVNKDDYRGILVFDGEGNFRGFFGSNPVGFTWRSLLIRLFATKAQKERIARRLPPPHSNVMIDDQGYIYTSTYYDIKNQIKKLSPAGVDVYNKGLVIRYGFRRRFGNPAFVDVGVDDRGIISALDAGTGQVYQYDQDRHFLLVFGAKGDGKSEFKLPSSIFVDKARKIYVLDKELAAIKVFRPTHFAT
ncbi:MAG: NHL repeat-containing protein, partial [Bacillota bacterium]